MSPITETYYEVGGFPFAVALPPCLSCVSLPPSFRPFRISPCPSPGLLFRLVCEAAPAPAVPSGAVLLEEQRNDLGLTRLYAHGGCYLVVLSAPGGRSSHVMHACDGFTRCRAWVDPSDPQCGVALGSLLRVAYSQSVLLFGGVSVHASCVVLGGLAYLFMGPSGTGKSTHSRQWLSAFPGSWLLNDDNPVLRVSGAEVRVYGSPWSGKTACYHSASSRVGGLVRLRQGRSNCFTACRGVEAFSVLLPGCSFIRQDGRLRESLYDTLALLSSVVAVGRLSCLPDESSARVCLHGLETETNNQTERHI